MTIKELMQQAFAVGVEKGWYTPARNIYEVFCLLSTEVSECVEEYRKGSIVPGIAFGADLDTEGYPLDKPVGLPSELADVILSVAAIAEWQSIDLEAAIKTKLEFNAKRGKRGTRRRSYPPNYSENTHRSII